MSHEPGTGPSRKGGEGDGNMSNYDTRTDPEKIWEAAELFAKSIAWLAELEAMKEANRLRLENNETPAYAEEAFQCLAEDIRKAIS